MLTLTQIELVQRSFTAIAPIADDAIHSESSSWTEELENDWRTAITAIAVPMLQGAAVRTAIVAEEMADSENTD